MDYIRQTVDSDKLSGVFDLPMSLRHKRVDVIILPAESEVRKPDKTGSAFGCLCEYANPNLIPYEKGAWERAAAEKHANC